MGEEWYAILTTRDGGGKPAMSNRTDLFVSQLPLTGIRILNHAYDGPMPDTVGGAGPPSRATAQPGRTRRHAPSRDALAASADPHTQLRQATRVTDVLMVVYHLDNVPEITAFQGSLIGTRGADHGPSVSSAVATPPVATTSASAEKNAARGGSPATRMTDVFALDNTRRVPSKLSGAQYTVIAVMGPVDSREAALSIGMLWRHNCRAVHSRQEHGYKISLHFNLNYFITEALTPPPPPVARSRLARRDRASLAPRAKRRLAETANRAGFVDGEDDDSDVLFPIYGDCATSYDDDDDDSDAVRTHPRVISVRH